MAAKESQELAKMRRKLQTLEPTLKEMLSLARPTSILKEKLAQVEELIMDIPDECTYLAAEWRGKLAKWYRDYSSMLVIHEPTPSDSAHAALGSSSSSAYLSCNSQLPSSSSNSKASKTQSATSAAVSNDFETAHTNGHSVTENGIEAELAPLAPQSQPVEQQQQYQPPVPQQQPYDSQAPKGDDGQLDHFLSSKESVKQQLEEAFDILRPITSFEHADEVKKLAKLVSKADDLLEPYWRDRDLQAAMLERLCSKLPAEKWDQFEAFIGEIPSGYKTVRNLKRFLVRQLRIIYDELRAKAEAEQASTDSGDGSSDLYCVYCKGNNHMVDECVQIKYTLCFICLEDGHTQRRCPQAPQQPMQRGGGGGSSSWQ